LISGKLHFLLRVWNCAVNFVLLRSSILDDTSVSSLVFFFCCRSSRRAVSFPFPFPSHLLSLVDFANHPSLSSLGKSFASSTPFPLGLLAHPRMLFGVVLPDGFSFLTYSCINILPFFFSRFVSKRPYLFPRITPVSHSDWRRYSLFSYSSRLARFPPDSLPVLFALPLAALCPRFLYCLRRAFHSACRLLFATVLSLHTPFLFLLFVVVAVFLLLRNTTF